MLEVKLTPSRDGIELGSVGVEFVRTVRIPDDGRDHALPPSLGMFPVRRVADYADRVPAAWTHHGGVFLPMHEREAMWLSFRAPADAPHALKVGMGMINAVTGAPWSDALDGVEQDYVVVPYQPWLDGIKTTADTVRQFVAMPLGSGYTVEGQLTGQEQHGGLQLLACPAKPGAIAPEDLLDTPAYGFEGTADFEHTMCASIADVEPEMGMAAGGSMHQNIYDDPHGVGVWDQTRIGRVYVHLCSPQQWTAITGEEAPALPREVEDYHGPWFAMDDDQVPAVPGSEILNSVSSVGAIDAAAAAAAAAPAPEIVVLQPKVPASSKHAVRDGDW